MKESIAVAAGDGEVARCVASDAASDGARGGAAIGATAGAGASAAAEAQVSIGRKAGKLGMGASMGRGGVIMGDKWLNGMAQASSVPASLAVPAAAGESGGMAEGAVTSALAGAEGASGGSTCPSSVIIGPSSVIIGTGGGTPPRGRLPRVATWPMGLSALTLPSAASAFIWRPDGQLSGNWAAIGRNA